MALKQCVDCLPSVREVDEAMRALNAIAQRLASEDFPQSDRSFQEVQMDLSDRAQYLNKAATEIVSASHNNQVGVDTCRSVDFKIKISIEVSVIC